MFIPTAVGSKLTKLWVYHRKLLIPATGFYSKHFGSIKPEVGCEVVWSGRNHDRPDR
ncbi:MAG: hypothetical protein ACTS43_01080 [Candidatus Hodgkinia cicadicola]